MCVYIFVSLSLSEKKERGFFGEKKKKKK